MTFPHLKSSCTDLIVCTSILMSAAGYHTDILLSREQPERTPESEIAKIGLRNREHPGWSNSPRELVEDHIFETKKCNFSSFIILRFQEYSRLILRNSAVCQIETRASGMVWGPRSMGCVPIFWTCQKVPPARKVPYDPSILIPLGINRGPSRRQQMRNCHIRLMRS